MQDLRSALQFVCLTIIARLGVYLIVRLIEVVKPRSAHFIITSSLKPDEWPQAPREFPPLGNPKPGDSPVKGSRERLRLRGKSFSLAVRWQMQGYLVRVVNRLRSRPFKPSPGFSPKLLTELIGMITALVSLVIILLNYFLK